MSKTVISPVTTASDIATFSPIIARCYASSQRLVATGTSLTSDISEILYSARKHETAIDMIRTAVQVQLTHCGSGGRTVAHLSCLFYQLLADLADSGVEVEAAGRLLDLAVERCISQLTSISVSTAGVGLAELVERLSHGTVEWRLVADALSRVDYANQKCKVTDCVTVYYENSAEESKLYPAYLLRCNSAHVSGFRNTLLVSGDIKENPNHIGYKGLVKEKQVVTSAEGLKTNSSWHGQVGKLMADLGVDVVLCCGTVDSILKSNDKSVVFLEARYEFLELLAAAENTDLIPYLEAAITPDILPLQFEYLGKWLSVKSGKCDHVTIVQRGPVSLTSRLKSLISRVDNATKLGYVLPGAGKSELFCAEFLQTVHLTEDMLSDYELYHPDVYIYWDILSKRLSDVFLKIHRLVGSREESGSLEFDIQDLDIESQSDSDDSLDENLSKVAGLSKDTILDDSLSKTGAWRRALEIARTLVSVKCTIKPVADQAYS